MAKSKPVKKAAGSSAKSIDRSKATPPRNDAFAEEGSVLTTNQGLVISDNHNSLKAGVRGPTLLEDFVLREKIMSFDHERIPERVVHARGAGAFGYFECAEDMSRYTSAGFLSKVGKRTPMLVRFSTVGGSRGSADTARDVRGFAARFYTEEGNYDLVGNNIPVFFIQDAMKFPDLIHAAKPDQDKEIPQAQTAHDTFWDFISLMPESLHMACWIMSDRTIPRSFRMMEGFGVHTFRFVNAKGEGTFVKFHWKPKLGAHGLLWEESQMLAGLDPDFHRRDLWEAIENESYPEWELGVQLIPEKDEMKFPFDLLDPTKLVPEELVPVRIIGRMTLNRNPDNYFSEIEQVAFHPANLVPGIDFSNDPLLQGRLFSYTDTQLTRLGGPNFHELPVNRPIAPVHNNNRDGFGRQLIPKGRVAYEPNSLKGGCPFHAAMREGPQAFASFTESMAGHKVRARSETFADFHSQATLFYDSQTPVEQQHMKDAFTFELSKVESQAVRQRTVELLAHASADLAESVAKNLNMKIPARPSLAPRPGDPQNDIVPKNRTTNVARADGEENELGSQVKLPSKSRALSMIAAMNGEVETRKIALLITDETPTKEAEQIMNALEGEGLVVELLTPIANALPLARKFPEAEKWLGSNPSHAYDAVYVLTSEEGYADDAKMLGCARRFVGQAFKHCKTIAANEAGADLLDKATFGLSRKSPGVVASKAKNVDAFIEALREHRHWEREALAKELPY